MVEVHTQNIRGGEGVGFFVQDFYLNPKKGGLADSELGVVFAQEVPPEAKKLYDTALKDLGNKRTEEGVNELHQAVKIFPEYYDALHRLGKELFILGNYEQAYPFLMKAAEVNQKSATSLYYLGYSLFNLGHKKAAVTALTAANVLAPASVQILIVLGRAERGLGKFDDAEKHLLHAKKLARTSIAEIHKELAQLYANDLKKYVEAAEELELYLKASKLEGDAAKDIKKKISELREKSKTSPAKT
jgi:tetratricopeptide (TPR) repeat protein